MKLINTFATELPWACEPVAPQPLHAPGLLHLNRALLGELGRERGVAASYTLRPGDRYVRAVVTAADGRRAWTQPLWP